MLHIDESWTHYAGWKQLVTKDHILFTLFVLKFQIKQFNWQKDFVIVGGQVQGRVGSDY